ncbi:prolyl oligopeptidase family serine peptidase [Pseudokineococcus lusitanus]|uniref:Esterase/PHB depolymerase n=1 Tax=Pseudokineococcus lusitanus TaxID=763993 RepID=A0A3N1G9L4_9ACTN|nr:PHB depolymerase family esterase [Pseudokineococcus lusitanus]ROP26926.1 esterase/PHB depolymerase [Pseudokineococcus lusitanus]
MTRPLTLLAAVAVPLALTLTALPAQADTPRARGTTAVFTLDAEVQDGGQQVVSLTVDARRLGLSPGGLSEDTFRVTASGSNPFPALEGPVFGTFEDVEREVVDVRLESRGRIVIDLADGFGTPGAGTLGYAAGVGRNVELDLEYTVTQEQPLTVRGRDFTFSALEQGELVDPEVDAFTDGEANGLAYRLFSPPRRGERPLVIWLHGGGEGGWEGSYDNDLALQANRGAVGFVTPEAQQVFKGAYVLAPQAPDFWLNDPARGYSAQLKGLIDEVVAENRIDTDRIYVVGASNGGYMTAQLVADNPDFFAADVPIAAVRDYGGSVVLTDDELDAMSGTPTWVVHAENDATVPYEPNGLYMAQRIDGALLSAYPDVTYDGVMYDGHWSWVYVGRNDPTTADGTPIWQWMAAQRR